MLAVTPDHWDIVFADKSITVSQLVALSAAGLARDDFYITYGGSHVEAIIQGRDGSFLLRRGGKLDVGVYPSTRLIVLPVPTIPLSHIFVDGSDLAAGDVVFLRDGTTFTIDSISGIHINAELGAHRFAWCIYPDGWGEPRRFANFSLHNYTLCGGPKLDAARWNARLTKNVGTGYLWIGRSYTPPRPLPPQIIVESACTWDALHWREKALLKKARPTGDVCVTCGNKTAYGLSRKGLLAYRFGNSRKFYYDLTPAARAIIPS